VAAAWSDVPATGGLSECAALVRSAEALRTSAPELSVQLARRALLVGASDISSTSAHTGEARALSMRAQAVLASGLVRTSQHVGAVEPGFAALALAESGGALVLAAELRLDLAACAQELGEPLLGGALLRPVLEATQAPPSVRAAALGRLVGCVAHVARRDDVEDALAEADRLLAADDGVNQDARRMERAALAVRSAAYHRWYGDNEDAATAARDGLNLLGRLQRELRPESDRLHARLVLELVCALLDEGELSEAEDVARPTVDEPVRATSAESVCQLMLAMATRVHLPAGEVDRGRVLLDQAAWLAERHSLDAVLADALTEVSRLDEQAGRATGALEAMRSARAAEQRRMRAVSRAARHLLVQVGAGQGARDVTQQAVAALLRQLAHPAGVPVAMAPPPTTLPPPKTDPEPQTPPATSNEQAPKATTDERTNLLNREDLVRRLRSVRTGERPVALTLVRFEPTNDNPEENRGPDTGIMVGLADKVRDIAPENAELARSDGGELAVLMPHTTRDQAEEFAATIRETATKSDWLADVSGKDMSISTSVVQSDPQQTDPDTQPDATGMLTAARDALTAPPPQQAPPPTNSLTETKAALSALSQLLTAGPTAHPSSPIDERPQPNSALTEDTPTVPLHMATGDSPRAGRSILSNLSIPSGSGGRRRADGEPAPGSKTRRPTDTPEAPRLTRAERRAHEQSTTSSPSGWPAEPDISQPLRRTTQPERPPAATSTTVDTGTTAGGPPEPTAPTAAPNPPTSNDTKAMPDRASSYEETRAELARMMSALNAKALRSRTKTDGNATAASLNATTPGSHGGTGSSHGGTPSSYGAIGSSHSGTPSSHSGTGSSHGGTAISYSGTGGPNDGTGNHDHATPENLATGTASTDPASQPALSNHWETADRSDFAGRGQLTGQSDFASPGDLVGPSGLADRSDFAGRSQFASPGDPTNPGEFADRGDFASRGQFLSASDLAGRHDLGDQPALPGWHDRVVAPGPAESSDFARWADSSARFDAPTLGDPLNDPLSGPLAPRQTIPTPPDPDEMPEPPNSPDIPEPPSRPDIPEPPDPDPIPPFRPDPGPLVPPDPGKPPGEDTRSRLMAAFDALTGPVPSVGDSTDTPSFRTDFESGTGLPSRKPAKSWAELESSAVVESPADDLFGLPADTSQTPARSSLGDAFADFDRADRSPEYGEPATAAQPTEPPSTESQVLRPTPMRFSSEVPLIVQGEVIHNEPARSTSAELRAALWGGPRTTQPEPGESPVTFDEWSPGGPGDPRVEPVHSKSMPAVTEPSSATSGDAQSAQKPEPSGAGWAPSGASVAPTEAPTYDEPIGPQRRPEGLPRRGERSATTIASLLTEALAAYQSSADDQGEPHRTPERFDSFLADEATMFGRHRSPE
jgi:GGDEF domain-containing protein